jgi:hypothetical protein
MDGHLHPPDQLNRLGFVLGTIESIANATTASICTLPADFSIRHLRPVCLAIAAATWGLLRHHRLATGRCLRVQRVDMCCIRGSRG